MNMVLEDLEQSGFIMGIKDFGKKKKETEFKLVDEYSRFYLKWIKKAKEDNLGDSDNNFWMNVFNSPLGRS